MEGLDPSLKKTGDQAEQVAEARRDADRDDADDQGYAGPEHDAAEHVPPEVVGAEPVFCARAHQLLLGVHLRHVVAGDEGGEEGQEDHDAHADHAGAAHGVAPELAQEAFVSGKGPADDLFILFSGHVGPPQL